ncbi:MAG: cytidylate kinase, partial [Algoriphagus sp.]
MGKIVIAIDGYSGCGKSSTAKALAKNLGYT